MVSFLSPNLHPAPPSLFCKSNAYPSQLLVGSETAFHQSNNTSVFLFTSSYSSFSNSLRKSFRDVHLYPDI